MYGLVNQSIKNLLIEAHGKTTWDQIRAEADAPEDYAPLEPCDDSVTYNLVGAPARILGQPADALLYQFGVYWVERIATVHYAEMMNTSGTDFSSFLKNLDQMHERMRVTFPGYRPPSFRVLELDDARLQVDYYSSRQGLLPFVEGLLQGVASHFGRNLTITLVPDAPHGLPCRRMQLVHGPKMQ